MRLKTLHTGIHKKPILCKGAFPRPATCLRQVYFSLHNAYYNFEPASPQQCYIIKPRKLMAHVQALNGQSQLFFFG